MTAAWDDDAILIPVDEVAWQNDMYMAAGQQVCVGHDGITRPFTIPLSVRKGWAKRGEKNPYTNRVELELIDQEARAAQDRLWAEAMLEEPVVEGWHTLMARNILRRMDRPPLWQRILHALGFGQ